MAGEESGDFRLLQGVVDHALGLGAGSVVCHPVGGGRGVLPDDFLPCGVYEGTEFRSGELTVVHTGEIAGSLRFLRLLILFLGQGGGVDYRTAGDGRAKGNRGRRFLGNVGCVFQCLVPVFRSHGGQYLILCQFARRTAESPANKTANGTGCGLQLSFFRVLQLCTVANDIVGMFGSGNSYIQEVIRLTAAALFPTVGQSGERPGPILSPSLLVGWCKQQGTTVRRAEIVHIAFVIDGIRGEERKNDSIKLQPFTLVHGHDLHIAGRSHPLCAERGNPAYPCSQ